MPIPRSIAQMSRGFPYISSITLDFAMYYVWGPSRVFHTDATQLVAIALSRTLALYHPHTTDC